MAYPADSSSFPATAGSDTINTLPDADITMGDSALPPNDNNLAFAANGATPTTDPQRPEASPMSTADPTTEAALEHQDPTSMASTLMPPIDGTVEPAPTPTSGTLPDPSPQQQQYLMQQQQPTPADQTHPATSTLPPTTNFGTSTLTPSASAPNIKPDPGFPHQTTTNTSRGATPSAPSVPNGTSSTNGTAAGTGVSLGHVIHPTSAHGSPTRVYLNSRVTPVLLEGMKYLAKHEPERPLEWLARFLGERSRELEGDALKRDDDGAPAGVGGGDV